MMYPGCGTACCDAVAEAGSAQKAGLGKGSERTAHGTRRTIAPSRRCHDCGAVTLSAAAMFCHICGGQSLSKEAAASSSSSLLPHRAAPERPQRRQIPVPARPVIDTAPPPSPERSQPLGFGSSAPQRRGLALLKRGENGGEYEPHPSHRQPPVLPRGVAVPPSRRRPPPRPRPGPPLQQPRMIFTPGASKIALLPCGPVSRAPKGGGLSWAQVKAAQHRQPPKLAEHLPSEPTQAASGLKGRMKNVAMLPPPPHRSAPSHQNVPPHPQQPTSVDHVHVSVNGGPRKPPLLPWKQQMLNSATVRSFITHSLAALRKRAHADPEHTPSVLILVEMGCKVGAGTGSSLNHNAAVYNHYMQRVSAAVGDCVRSPEPDSDATISAMVSLAPPPTDPSAAGERGVLARLDPSLPSNVAFAHARESRLGAFEVYMLTSFPADGSLAVPRVAGLHSKLWTRRFPHCGRLIKELQNLLLPAFRRLDGDEALSRALQPPAFDAQLLRDVFEVHGPFASPEVVERARARLGLVAQADSALQEGMAQVVRDAESTPESEALPVQTAVELRRLIGLWGDDASVAVRREAEAVLAVLEDQVTAPSTRVPPPETQTGWRSSID
jgi:hypothetical protein